MTSNLIIVEDDDSRIPGAGLGRPSPISSVSRKDAVRIEIRRAVVQGHLKPGDKLTETQLATDLGVSRPTVREALNQLAGEGLIVQEPYRGLHVAEVTAQQVRDIAVVRMGLDMLAIDAILADPTGQRVQAVEAGWEHFKRSAFAPDLVARHDAHLIFHEQIWVASQNYLLLNMWPVMEAHITILLAEDQLTRSDPERAYRLHADLMEAIRSGDRDVIEASFVAHTICSANDYAELLEQKETSQ